MDLWATFGQYDSASTIPRFDCHVGITDDECGGVEFHGDSHSKTHGTSSESITFHTIGRFDYLVYFNRWYHKLPLVNAATEATNWVTDIASF